MDAEALEERVRQLHGQGLSTNAIVRKSGLSRARVAPVVRAVARERRAASPEPPIIGCWVSGGWSSGLTVPADRDWPDPYQDEHGGPGLAAVMVAREHRRSGGDVTVSGYLIDPYCLGAKNALGPKTMGRNRMRRFVAEFFDGFDDPPVEAPVELARHLVWGAVAYARELGFEPHRDFRSAAGHLGELDGPSSIRFGWHGKPHYIQGPYDDPDRILRTLNANVRPDNARYLVEVPTG